MKAYNIALDDTERLIVQIARRWRSGYERQPLQVGSGYETGYEPPITGYVTGYGERTSGDNERATITGYHNHFPIRAGRPLTHMERQAVRRLAEAGKFEHRGQFSLNRAVLFVYGSKSPERLAWVREALEQVDGGE